MSACLDRWSLRAALSLACDAWRLRFCGRDANILSLSEKRHTPGFDLTRHQQVE